MTPRFSSLAPHRLTLFTLVILLLAACSQPSTSPTAPSELPLEGVGLYAEYFSNSDFTGKSVSQIDSKIDFFWGDASPALDIIPHNFSARWTGFLSITENAEYLFSIKSDGEVAVWLDNKIIYRDDVLNLKKGKYPIKIEFSKTSLNASLSLGWLKNNTSYELIPQVNLSPSQNLNAQNLQTQAGTNLLLNAGFEDGKGSWKVSGTNSLINPGQGNSKQALRSSNYAWIQQDLAYSAINSGQTYTLSAYGKTTDECAVGIFGGSNGLETFDKEISFSQNSWTKRSTSVQLPAGTTWATVFINSGSTNCDIDNVSLSLGNGSSDSNIVRNGAFNEGKTYWETYYSTGSLDTGKTGQGFKSNGWAWTQQDLPYRLIEAGSTYKFSANGKANSDCTLGIWGGRQSQFDFEEEIIFTNPSWQQKALDITLPAGTIWATVYINSGQEDCTLDDISFTKTSSPTITPPAKPTNLRATKPSSTSVEICWNQAARADSYLVERKHPSGSYKLVERDVSGTCYNNTGLTEGIDYIYRVTAVNVSGETVGDSIKVERIMDGPSDAVYLDDIVEYSWTYGCTPTALGMLMGYWDRNGYSNLIPGDSSTYTTAVQNALASNGYISDYGDPFNKEKFSDDHGIVKDYSELSKAGGTHTNDSLADYLETAHSRLGLDYGWTYLNRISGAINSFSRQKGYNFRASAYSINQYNINSLASSIDQGRPVVLSVDSSGGGQTDHNVIVVGYSKSTNQYAFLAGWSTETRVRWTKLEGVERGRKWGTGWAWFVRP